MTVLGAEVVRAMIDARTKTQKHATAEKALADARRALIDLQNQRDEAAWLCERADHALGAAVRSFIKSEAGQ